MVGENLVNGRAQDLAELVGDFGVDEDLKKKEFLVYCKGGMMEWGRSLFSTHSLGGHADLARVEKRSDDTLDGGILEIGIFAYNRWRFSTGSVRVFVRENVLQLALWLY